MKVKKKWLYFFTVIYFGEAYHMAPLNVLPYVVHVVRDTRLRHVQDKFEGGVTEYWHGVCFIHEIEPEKVIEKMLT